MPKNSKHPQYRVSKPFTGSHWCAVFYYQPLGDWTNPACNDCERVWFFGWDLDANDY